MCGAGRPALARPRRSRMCGDRGQSEPYADRSKGAQAVSALAHARQLCHEAFVRRLPPKRCPPPHHHHHLGAALSSAHEMSQCTGSRARPSPLEDARGAAGPTSASVTRDVPPAVLARCSASRKATTSVLHTPGARTKARSRAACVNGTAVPAAPMRGLVGTGTTRCHARGAQVIVVVVERVMHHQVQQRLQAHRVPVPRGRHQQGLARTPARPTPTRASMWARGREDLGRPPHTRRTRSKWSSTAGSKRPWRWNALSRLASTRCTVAVGRPGTRVGVGICATVVHLGVSGRQRRRRWRSRRRGAVRTAQGQRKVVGRAVVCRQQCAEPLFGLEDAAVGNVHKRRPSPQHDVVRHVCAPRGSVLRRQRCRG